MSDNKPRLKHFLLKHLEDSTYKEQLQWVDRDELTFRVLWMHAGRATFDRDRHQKLFYKYREYRGKKIFQQQMPTMKSICFYEVAVAKITGKMNVQKNNIKK